MFIALGAALVIGSSSAHLVGFRLGWSAATPPPAARASRSVTLLLSAMAVGGRWPVSAAAQLAGAEFKLRSGFIATYGYIGFPARGSGQHKPGYVVLASVLLSIAISGDSLQLDSQLPRGEREHPDGVILPDGVRLRPKKKTAQSDLSERTGLRTAVHNGGLAERGPHRRHPRWHVHRVRGARRVGLPCGVVNLGTEGSMLCGPWPHRRAETGHPWFGVLGGAVAGGLLALVHAYFVQPKANQLATGLVVLSSVSG
jgi:hypothetical protein